MKTAKIKTGWKILLKGSDGTMYSALKGSVVYEQGEFIRPHKHCGPLAVFCSRRKALDFMHYQCCGVDDRYIARCQYVPSRYKFLWLSYTSGLRHEVRRTLPAGTRLARLVKISKPVKLREYMLTLTYRRHCRG